MAGLLQRAWDWLTPPELPVTEGKLVKRTRGGQPPSLTPPAPLSTPPVQAALDFAPPLAALPGNAEPPAAFVHPLANQALQLAGVVVGYRLERSRRRSIGMMVGAEGLRVRAPLGVARGAVERVLQDKADWIVRKLREQQQRSQQEHSARIAWGAQTQLPYLGQLVTVQPLAPAPGVGRPAALLPAADAWAGAVLQLPLPAGACADQIRAAAHAWWLATAHRHFTERLNHFAPQLGVQWRSLRLSSARTRWGSARSDGSIRLNWRLMHYAPQVIDYVVVHELSHLRHMDHSPRFWATVASVLPDYRALRQQLRDQVAPQWADDDA